MGVHGIHHVTAICGPAQENLDFYVGVLGLRLVKRSVNQDDPTTYHLFYADGAGTPGTDLTFFPWPDLPPAREGTGRVMTVAFAVHPESLDYWQQRLTRYGVAFERPPRPLGRRCCAFRIHMGSGWRWWRPSRSGRSCLGRQSGAARASTAGLSLGAALGAGAGAHRAGADRAPGLPAPCSRRSLVSLRRRGRCAGATGGRAGAARRHVGA